MIKKLIKSVRQYKLTAVLTPVSVALEVAAEIIIPLLIADLIDFGNKEDNRVIVLSLSKDAIDVVVASNTIHVGTVAGCVKDSQIINVNIKALNEDKELTFVTGENLVGGVAGSVLGNSYVANINIEHVSVKATTSSQQNVNISNNILFFVTLYFNSL